MFGSLYRSVSKVNVHHSFWFWTSLAMVFLIDLFVIAVSENIISDRILFGVVSMLEDYSVHEYDVLVIGAGGAGLRAAIEASSSGAKVAIISKSMLGKAHTVMAEVMVQPLRWPTRISAIPGKYTSETP